MKRHHVNVLILVTALALGGLIFTQAFWIMKSFRITSQQYNHRADMALQDVISELDDFVNDTSMSAKYANYKKSDNPGNLFDVLDTNFLSYLFEKYIHYHMLDTVYYYNVVHTSDKDIIFSSAENPGLDKTPEHIHKACLSCIWKEDYYHLALIFPQHRQHILVEMGSWLLFSIIFLLVVVLIFIYNILVIIRQKKISEMKNDFINNMTHEFKTPISTISLTSEMLQNPDKLGKDEKVRRYARIIFDENVRMRNQVERVLQIAQLDREDYHIKKSKLDVHKTIEETVNNLCLENFTKKPVKIEYDFKSTYETIQADQVHFKNIVSNLVENATKYSKDNPKIKITTSNNDLGIIIKVIDNGIGIDKQYQKYVFDKFYRIPTGNVHDVKGFGLGLYYVKTIIEAHKGTIDLESEPGKGSIFEIHLPAN